jgi:iron-sulfur cluster assembly protein
LTKRFILDNISPIRKERFMLQEIETDTTTTPISLTASAIQAVERILKERNLNGYALRVYVAGGGCCGVQFGMALDNNRHQNDMLFAMGEVNVIVDDQSMNYLRGAKIDFVNDPVRGAGFVVDSPSAKKESGSCACNSSDAQGGQEEGCACGSSCGCNE